MTRIALRGLEYLQRQFIECGGLDPRVLDDLYEIVWHESLALDSSAIQINVTLPLEVRDQCEKINERRKKLDQRQSDIKSTIIKWANSESVNPSYAVFVGPSAVLFFDNEKEAVVAHLYMSDHILEFKKFRYGTLYP